MSKGFQKGNTLSTGRPKGSKDKKTTQWEIFEEFMMNAGLDRFERDIQSLDPKDFVDKVIQMMEYFKPKLARQEVTGKDGKDLPQPIINVSTNNSDK